MCRKTAWCAGLLLFVFYVGCDVGDTPKRMPLNPPGIDPLMDIEHPGPAKPAPAAAPTCRTAPAATAPPATAPAPGVQPPPPPPCRAAAARLALTSRSKAVGQVFQLVPCFDSNRDERAGCAACAARRRVAVRSSLGRNGKVLSCRRRPPSPVPDCRLPLNVHPSATGTAP